MKHSFKKKYIHNDSTTGNDYNANIIEIITFSLRLNCEQSNAGLIVIRPILCTLLLLEFKIFGITGKQISLR